MTNEELDKKIEMLRGQGNQVDVGGVLADVLKELAPKSAIAALPAVSDRGVFTIQELADEMFTTEDEVRKMFSEDVASLYYEGKKAGVLFERVLATRTSYRWTTEGVDVTYCGILPVVGLREYRFQYDATKGNVLVERVR